MRSGTITNREIDMYVTDASQSHAPDIAELIKLTGDHLPFYLWEIEAKGAKSPREVAENRIASSSEISDFSYQNARICVENDNVIGTYLGFKLSANASLHNLHEYPEPLIPIVMLESKAPGAWFLHTISVREADRNRGVAKLMMHDAETIAQKHGCHEIALIVNSNNKAALSLYGSLGYTSKDQTPVIPYPGCAADSHWVLLTLPLTGQRYHSKDDQLRQSNM